MYSAFETFTKALYNEDTTEIVTLLKLYERLLQDENTDFGILHSNRIRQYREEITDIEYMSELREHFKELFCLISKMYSNLKFILDGRIKSVVSMDRKIVKKLNDNESLDKIRDTVAFRTLIFGNLPEYELIDNCYNIMNDIIHHNIRNGYLPCDPGEMNGTMKKKSAIREKLLIPKESKIDARFRYCVKDYIMNPKENGYQSLHCSFYKPRGGQSFEVQVRTLTMHDLAESGDASHSDYKKKNYAEYPIDPDKVFIQGYSNTYDFVGLEKGLQVLRAQKVF